MSVGLANIGAAAALARLNELTPDGRFRRTIRIDLATGGGASGLEAMGEMRLTATFAVCDSNALAMGAPERAKLEASSGGLTLSLPVARRIESVRLHSSVTGELAAFRFDGPVVSEQAVATNKLEAGRATLRVTDRQLILRRDGQSLAPSDVKEVTVRYEIANPRVGLAISDDGIGVEFLVPDQLPSQAGTLKLGSAFVVALEARIARFAEARGGPLPNPLSMEIILEADQPCHAGIAELALDYALTAPALAAGDTKQHLRFPGGRRVVETVAIALPTGAKVLSAPLSIERSAGKPRAGVSASNTASSEDEPDGIAFNSEKLVATRVDLANARVVTGAVARIAAIETSEVTARLLAVDQGGMPGQLLAESAPVEIQTVRPTTVDFVFRPAATLAAGPAWLALSATGKAVLLLGGDDGDGSVAFSTTTNATWLPAAPGRNAIATLLFAPLADVQEETLTPFTAALGSTPIMLEQDAGGTAFKAEIASLLNGLPSSSRSQAQIQIETDQCGAIIIEPLTLHYAME